MNLGHRDCIRLHRPGPGILHAPWIVMVQRDWQNRTCADGLNRPNTQLVADFVFVATLRPFQEYNFETLSNRDVLFSTRRLVMGRALQWLGWRR